jgi:hypothetical protein
MAAEFLDINATSMAVGNWKIANGTAGSGFADGADLTVQGGGEPIVSNVDWSSLTDGPNQFKVAPARTGDLGTASAPVKFDCDQGSTPQIIDHGGSGTFHWQGAATRVSVDKGAGGGFHQLGGTVANYELVGGQLTVENAGVVTNVLQMGGQSYFGYNATDITKLEIWGGVAEVRRSGVIHAYGRCRIIVDIDPEDDDAPALEINMHHPEAELEVRNCTTIPVVRRYRSRIDLTRSRKPITNFGATTHIAGPEHLNALVYDAARHTVSAYTPIGGGKRSVGGPMPTGL